MSKVGGYSYGSSQNHYADLLDAIVEHLPGLVAGMADGDVDPLAIAKARGDLQQRDETVARLRREAADLASRHEELRRYALALHERLRELDQQSAAAAGAKVRPLRPLP
ncbi:hypothetical protein [Homoserinimonas hongtaonis]|uniref:Uncharacterized protein n=1 Tax=Homoserinimonas hongtaonis TaxID=2079791 RepID=A0A2U1T1R5_9MICO|nr:hypothetical protein [Salinibacterium hongtaonis]PWB97819.1 hypothetical protein DF220_08230 [Salinibacterium hongtaonis]